MIRFGLLVFGSSACIASWVYGVVLISAGKVMWGAMMVFVASITVVLILAGWRRSGDGVGERVISVLLEFFSNW